jgi:hypothetical protein
LRSINASRPILSAAHSVNASRQFTTKLLEAQIGLGIAEATQTAVREAIEAAVYELVRDGLELGIWSMSGETPSAPSIQAHHTPETLAVGLRR